MNDCECATTRTDVRIRINPDQHSCFCSSIQIDEKKLGRKIGFLENRGVADQKLPRVVYMESILSYKTVDDIDRSQYMYSDTFPKYSGACEILSEQVKWQTINVMYFTLQ